MAEMKVTAVAPWFGGKRTMAPAITEASIGKFDYVLMNPPFDDQRDIDHVVHAMRFLKSGGKLWAVMSAGVEFRANAKAAAFRNLVERHRGKFHDLPAGSFADSGTMVNACIVEAQN